MATPPTTGLNGAWSLYRQCAMTSGFQKSQLELFTKISLWMGIVGAVVGTLTQYFAPDPASIPSKILGVIASAVVALAGLAATQATSGDRDKIWIKCRAAAESLKSAVYLYSASVPPFDGQSRAAALAQRVEKVLTDVAGVDMRPAAQDKQPPGPLTVDGYIQNRVDDQIGFYTRSAVKYQKKADFWRYCSIGAAVLSAMMGAVSAMTSLSPWVALMATLTTSVTAFVKNQRYQSMIGIYQTTAIRLQLLKDQWLDGGKSDADKAERDAFIQRCEETLAAENGAWVSQWSQQASPPPQPPKPDPPKGVPAPAAPDNGAPPGGGQ